MNSAAYMNRFITLTGKALLAHTVDGSITVEVNDVGREPTLFVLCKGNKKIYRGTVDVNDVFTEDGLKEKLAKIASDAKSAKEKADVEAKAEAEREAKEVYVFEVECGGPNAEGGGCGAPLSVEKVDKAEFDAVKGRGFGSFNNFNDSELPGFAYEALRENVINVKAKFRPCCSCRRTC